MDVMINNDVSTTNKPTLNSTLLSMVFSQIAAKLTKEGLFRKNTEGDAYPSTYQTSKTNHPVPVFGPQIIKYMAFFK